jgi:hypothetical protein
MSFDNCGAMRAMSIRAGLVMMGALPENASQLSDEQGMGEADPSSAHDEPDGVALTGVRIAGCRGVVGGGVFARAADHVIEKAVHMKTPGSVRVCSSGGAFS